MLTDRPARCRDVARAPGSHANTPRALSCRDLRVEAAEADGERLEHRQRVLVVHVEAVLADLRAMMSSQNK